MSYEERLFVLDMLPLTYDRGIMDLAFFYLAVYSCIDIDVANYVAFNDHPRTCWFLSYCPGL